MSWSANRGNKGYLRCAALCLGDNRLFARADKDGFRIHYRRSPGVEEVLKALLPDPDRALGEAEIFKPGSRTHAGRIMVAGNSYFLKRYNCRGLWYQIRHLLRRSRALRTWRVSWSFVEHGVPVPEPMICLEKRHMGFLGKSYILMEFGDDALTLRALWPTIGRGEKESLLLEIAEQFGRMHAAGCLHGDLKWDNLLVRCQSGQWQLKIVDLDGSHVLYASSNKTVKKDLDRFLRDLQKYEGDPTMARDFIECWNSCRK